jgi:ParB family chromosome partitioning protein
MSKRSDEQLRMKEELRRRRAEADALAVAPSGSIPVVSPDVAVEASGSPSPAALPPSPTLRQQSVGDMRTQGAATRRIAEGWEKGLAAKLEEKTAEADRLSAVVEELKALGVEWKILPIDPGLVDVVGFNRFSSTFDPKQDRAFSDLLDNIKAVGGNKQPGMVRPSSTHPGRYQLVFGERRLRACEQSSLKFTAIVADLSDDDVWLFREAENFGRKDKGILEQALALVDMPRRFAYGERSTILSKLKISKTHYQRLRAIAEVPSSIWEVIPAAHTTTAREASAVVDAYGADARAVKGRAARVRSDMSRAAAIQFLVSGSTGETAKPGSTAVAITRKGAAISVRVKSDSEETAKEIESDLRQWLEERGLHAPDAN